MIAISSSSFCGIANLVHHQITMIARCSFLFIFIYMAHTVFAMQGFRISGRVIDDSTKAPLEGVNVIVKGTEYGANTDEDGLFNIAGEAAGNRVILVARLLGFLEKEVEVNPNSGKEIVIALSPMWIDIRGPEINAVRIDTVWGSDELNVADFAFVDDGLLILTYQKEDRWKRDTESKQTFFSGCELRWSPAGGRDETTAGIPFNCTGLYTDYFNKVFLESGGQHFAIDLQMGVPRLELVNMDEFAESIKPVIDTVGTRVILSSYNPDYPAFEYYAFNTADSSLQKLRYIVDEEMMAMFRSEFKYLHPRDKLAAFRHELKTGIDKEIVAAYMSGFRNSNYYEPLNAPLLVKNDTLLIFDHHHDKLLKLDSRGEAIDSLLIQYHRKPKPEKWSGKVIKDLANDEVYTYYNRNGFTVLKRVNTETGIPDSSFELHHRYVEKIKLRDGWVYYIYRPFESPQKRILYRQRI